MINRTFVDKETRVEIDLYCAQCGDPLEVSLTDETTTGADIHAEPCATCTAGAKDQTQ